jgi:hypothetical protein
MEQFDFIGEKGTLCLPGEKRKIETGTLCLHDKLLEKERCRSF